MLFNVRENDAFVHPHHETLQILQSMGIVPMHQKTLPNKFLDSLRYIFMEMVSSHQGTLPL